MTEYGQAFYGSDEIHEIIGWHSGAYQTDLGNWISREVLGFSSVEILYRLPKSHWFYNRDEFKQAKKPSDEIARPLTDYSNDELQAEIERRKSHVDEITILARKVCADNNTPYHLQADFIEGRRDKTIDMRLARAAVIAGMELQKGRET